jgi:hypothetical protein
VVAHRQGVVLALDALTVARPSSALYFLARFLGDQQAVKNGRIGKRIARRYAGKVTRRGLGRLFR